MAEETKRSFLYLWILDICYWLLISNLVLPFCEISVLTYKRVLFRELISLTMYESSETYAGHFLHLCYTLDDALLIKYHVKKKKKKIKNHNLQCLCTLLLICIIFPQVPQTYSHKQVNNSAWNSLIRRAGGQVLQDFERDFMFTSLGT